MDSVQIALERWIEIRVKLLDSIVKVFVAALTVGQTVALVVGVT